MRLLEVTAWLGPDDRKRNIGHAFTAPAGTTGLDIVLEWEPHRMDGVPGGNDLSLSLYDPTGHRGAGHNRPNSRIRLRPAQATPGYAPGPIPPGNWEVALDTHMIVAPLVYSIRVYASFDDQFPPPPERRIAAPVSRGPGWYRGDLHAHTWHSDGDWDVADLVAWAHRRGLDFVTLSDHNTVAPLAEMASLASGKLLTIGGIELTTYHGHALALGVREWIDWRVSPGTGGIERARAETEAMGGLFVIAHPMAPGDPECTGCDWRFTEMMPGAARCVEIWNEFAWTEANERGLGLWHDWLNLGHRMVATCGTDIHGPDGADEPAGFNIVGADDCTEAAVLDAVRHGRLYLSSGPELTLSAISSGRVAGIGDGLPEGPASVSICWAKAPAGSELRWVIDGQAHAEAIPERGESIRELGPARWCTAEIRAANGSLLATTNPVFFGDSWL